MRIVLIYPPPWKIPARGEPAAGFGLHGDGPPPEFKAGDIDGDFIQTPHGLLYLAAQAHERGHQVKVLNLSAFAWSEVERVLSSVDADLFGLSCFTANRRGVGLVADVLRKHHERVPIIVGGPHVTALPRETLEHFSALDAAVVGEGETTFLELISRISAGAPLVGVPGTAYRDGKRVVLGPARKRIEKLDELASPHAHFSTHLLLTARGCPGRCTYCASYTVWGKEYRAHSAAYVLDELEMALDRLPVKMMMVKDDTFTANRKRAIEICRGIRERGLQFIWSCDTRADALGEELLREMRLAGCQRISIGVESGSRTILRNINKKIEPSTILRTTEAAKKVGMQVRYYMMLGNRGETAKTFRESLDFIKLAKPHQFTFACLSIYPGTKDFTDLERKGAVGREDYFDQPFLELKMPFDASPDVTRQMSDWFEHNGGLRDMHTETVDEYQAILAHLGDYHAAHLDLGGAYYRAGDYERAEHHVRRALELGYPLPGLAYNYLLCIAAQSLDVRGMKDAFDKAMALDPQHPVLAHNQRVLARWYDEGGHQKGTHPQLVASHEFVLLEKTLQPVLPGPLAEGALGWGDEMGI